MDSLFHIVASAVFERGLDCADAFRLALDLDDRLRCWFPRLPSILISISPPAAFVAAVAVRSIAPFRHWKRREMLGDCIAICIVSNQK